MVIIKNLLPLFDTFGRVVLPLESSKSSKWFDCSLLISTILLHCKQESKYVHQM